MQAKPSESNSQGAKWVLHVVFGTLSLRPPCVPQEKDVRITLVLSPY